MFKKRLAAIILMVALSVSMAFSGSYVYATVVDDSQKKSQEQVEKEDAEHTDEDTNRGEKIKALEKSIKDKQNQISQAEKEKKEIKNNITNMSNLVSTLEKEKADLSSYVSKLDSKLEEIEGKIDNLNSLIEKKEADIVKTTADLEEAQEVQINQYNSMKARIKFMYEKGDSYYIEMLIKAQSFGDMVNKADYIEKLSAYDKKKLDEYISFCEYVEACKVALEAEKESLDVAKLQVEEEKKNLETLISQKQKEITAKEYDINNKEQAIKEYEAYLAEQAAVIKALEAAVAEQKKKLIEESGNVVKYDGGVFAWPAPSYTKITDDYGNRIHPILGVQQFHNGVDMAAPGGSPILAAYDGEVVAAAYSSTMGNYVMINHGDDLYTIYMHASKLYVSQGKKVARGEKIAAVGSTGRSTGNHLHFSVRKDGSYVSPWKYVSK